MRIRLHPLDEGWDEIISSFEHSFFETSVWAKIVKHGYGCDIFLILLEDSSRILLVLPAMIFNFRIMRLLFAYYPYGNFLGNLSVISPFFKELGKILNGYNIARVRITEQAIEPKVIPPGYKEQISWQHLLDLRGKNEESIWSGYKKRVRRDIRRAQRSGVTVTEVESPKDIDDYYRLYVKTMIRNRAIGPHTKKFYKAIYQYLVKEGKACFLLAKVKSRIIGGLIMIFGDDIAYYLGNASDVRYLGLCPNDLLLHSAIMQTVKRKLRLFDFMTTSHDDSTLVNFKEKWGAEKVPFYTFEKDVSLLRTKIWDFLWKFNRTKIGTYIFNEVQLLSG